MFCETCCVEAWLQGKQVPAVEKSNDVATQHSLKCKAVLTTGFYIDRICACDSAHFSDTSGASILVIEVGEVCRFFRYQTSTERYMVHIHQDIQTMPRP